MYYKYLIFMTVQLIYEIYKLFNACVYFIEISTQVLLHEFCKFMSFINKSFKYIYRGISKHHDHENLGL